MENYKIIATVEQLKSIGLSEDELNKSGTLVRDYKDGWLCLKEK